MRRTTFLCMALALSGLASLPVLAQGDGAWQQAERERTSVPCQNRRGAGPDQSITVGSTLPKAFRGNQFVVNDWRSHNLGSPSFGAHWVQVGADYVLVEMLTNRVRAIKLYGC